MLLTDYEAAVVLVHDRRFHSEWPRLESLFKPRVKRLYHYVDGSGQILHPEMYDQLLMNVPPSWRHTQGGYQHFRAVQEIVRLAKHNGWESVLLIEDDCVLCEGFDEKLERACRLAGQGVASPDILYYGANLSGSRVRSVSPGVVRVKGALTTHLVGFRSTVYDAILALEPTDMIDAILARDVQPNFLCYAFRPALATQKPGPSLIWRQDVDYDEVFRQKGLPWDE